MQNQLHLKCIFPNSTINYILYNKNGTTIKNNAFIHVHIKLYLYFGEFIDKCNFTICSYEHIYFL